MLIMIFKFFNSHWTPVVRRQQEHGLAAFLGWVFVSFLCCLLHGLGGEQSGILWTWINPEAETIEASSIITVEDDVLHQKKASYLNLYFFSLRLILYFIFSADLVIGLGKFLSHRIKTVILVGLD